MHLKLVSLPSLLLFLQPITDPTISRLPADKQNAVCSRFTRRPVEVANSDEGRKLVQESFRAISNDIEFGFVCGSFDANTALPTNKQAHGMTSGQTSWRKIRCNIDFYQAEPLLNPNIHADERLLCQFQLALILLHELTVSKAI